MLRTGIDEWETIIINSRATARMQGKEGESLSVPCRASHDAQGDSSLYSNEIGREGLYRNSSGDEKPKPDTALSAESGSALNNSRPSSFGEGEFCSSSSASSGGMLCTGAFGEWGSSEPEFGDSETGCKISTVSMAPDLSGLGPGTIVFADESGSSAVRLADCGDAGLDDGGDLIATADEVELECACAPDRVSGITLVFPSLTPLCWEETRRRALCSASRSACASRSSSSISANFRRSTATIWLALRTGLCKLQRIII